MIIEIKVPSPGESITEVQIASWLVTEGSYVEKDTDIVEIDSDKATLSISAEASGIVSIKVEEGENVEVGSIIATIDTEGKGIPAKSAAKAEARADGKAEPRAAGKAETRADSKDEPKVVAEPVLAKETPAATASPAGADEKRSPMPSLHYSPLAKKMMAENNLSEAGFIEFFKAMRVTKKDVEFYLSAKDSASGQATPDIQSWGGTRDTEHKKMSRLRLKLSERLVAVKQETAMLTTFNEVNMTPIMEIRKQYKEVFKEKYGVGLGFMSFFTKAVTEAIQHFPQVNAQMGSGEVIFHEYADIGIAVSGPKGLVVPVLRNAESMSMAEIEMKIKELAIKASENKITIDEMKGGTFTISNGGVFGSMLSTPILNPPQSAILGMHNIVERPIAVEGKVEIHPVMFLALSYDHRIIDGRESVGFLVKVKEMLEDPVKMMYKGGNPVQALLGL
jgi:2-oxoglutarate dehydrogenase E2 component (dihydrolipoamide succinyltransferase)